jgi:hypothetical protein
MFIKICSLAEHLLAVREHDEHSDMRKNIKFFPCGFRNILYTLNCAEIKIDFFLFLFMM